MTRPRRRSPAMAWGLGPAVLAALLGALCLGGVEAEITMSDFKARMLKIYASAEDAFSSLDASSSDVDAALDAEPLDLEEFVHGTKAFVPALSEAEAKAAFAGLDVNGDGLIKSEEFLQVIESGHFGTASPEGDAEAEGGEGPPPEGGPAKPPISVADFQERVLEVYDSLPDAFAEMDASPTDLDAALDDEPYDLEEFVRGTSTFRRPLTQEQAEYVFQGLDADHDGLLSSSEFVGGVASGEFVASTTTVAPQTTSSLTATSTVAAVPAIDATETWTATATTTVTSTTLAWSARANEDVILFESFKASMLAAYASPIDAFNALGSNPSDVNTFIRIAETFHPPLTDREARYVFRGLDADQDQLLVSAEFLEVVHLGHYFPTREECELIFDTDTATTTPLDWAVGSHMQDAAASSPRVQVSVQFGLAFLILVGYVARTAFIAFRLPGACGVMLSGALFAQYVPEDLYSVSDNLQELILFATLFSTGFEVSLADISGNVLVMALLPATLEWSVIMLFGVWALGYTLLESLALGIALFAVGDGIVVPKMHSLGARFQGHCLPRIMRLAAPLEACFACTLFGTAIGLAAPLSGRPGGTASSSLLASALHLVVSIGAGAALGYLSGKLIPLRTRVRIRGRQCFAGTSAESFLIVFATGLAAFGLGKPGLFRSWPVASSISDPLFQPELLVLALGVVLASTMGARQVEGIESVVGGMWMVCQLILFWLLGSSADGTMLSHLHQTLPLMVIGLIARFIGTVLAGYLTLGSGPCRRASLLSDAAFCFLASLPRTTLQGSLGSASITGRLLMGVGVGSHGAQTVIAAAARLYILCLSTLGSLLLDALGPRLLLRSGGGSGGDGKRPAAGGETSAAKEAELFRQGWTSRQRAQAGGVGAGAGGDTAAAAHGGNTVRLGLISEDDVLFEDADAPAFPYKEAAQTLSRLYSIDPSVFLDAFQDHTVGALPAESSYTRLPHGHGGGLEAGDGAALSDHAKAVVRRVARPSTLPSAGLFEADGGPTAPEESSSGENPHCKAVRL